MTIAEERGPQIFPTLTGPQRQVALRFASGPVTRYEPGAVLYHIGDTTAPAYLVVRGEIRVLQGDGAPITTHAVGQISGELAQISGRPALAETRAGPEGCEAAPFDAAHLRALVIGSAEIGEIVMRAFILRRTAFIKEGGVGSVLVGRPNDAWLVRLEVFLRRNGYPYTTLDPADEGEAKLIIDRFALHAEDLPIALCPNGTLLKRPNEADLGACLGITPVLDAAKRYDVAVVGAGPAGLATAVYAASEGLSVIVLDSRAFGGQAGASSRIENYFGFPTGISGIALTARAFTQAQKFGAEIAIPLEVSALDCRDPHLRLDLTDQQSVQARSVVIASGVRYRRPDIPDLAAFEGAGIAYWASPIEAKLCEGEEIVLVGGGNSAGQAVAFLAEKVKHLHLVVRGQGLVASMSQYLIERIDALPNVTLHTRTEIVALRGDTNQGLSGITLRCRDTGAEREMPMRHVFLFIGADPNTDWLQTCGVTLDDKGFVVTDKPGGWSLETSVPGVFAIGDVRSGSTKRVAAAVGEGAAVVAQIHALLARQNESAAP